MIELFRKNLFINSILLLPYLIFLRFNNLLNPKLAPIIEGEGFLSVQLKSISDRPLVHVFIAIFFVYLQALIINRLVIKQKITKEFTLIPGLVYLLLTSLIPDPSLLTGALIGNTFILGAMYHLLSTYNNPEVSSNIFLAGFYTGMAGLFYFPYVYLLLYVYLGFVIIRSFVMVERIQLLAGWGVAFFLVSVAEYWYSEPSYTIPDYFVQNFGINIVWFKTGVREYIMFGVLIFFVLLSLINYSAYMAKKTTAIQKKIDILYWAMAFCGLTFVFYNKFDFHQFYLFAIPVSIFFSMNLIRMKNRLLPEIIHLLIILAVIVLQYNLIQF